MEIELISIKSQNNVADIFTKSLKYETYSLLRKGLGMASSTQEEILKIKLNGASK